MAQIKAESFSLLRVVGNKYIIPLVQNNSLQRGCMWGGENIFLKKIYLIFEVKI